MNSRYLYSINFERSLDFELWLRDFRFGNNYTQEIMKSFLTRVDCCQVNISFARKMNRIEYTYA